MGEEVVKVEETKAEEPDEKAVEEKKQVEEFSEKEPKQQHPLPQPQDIVLRVFMHCEGCARKVRRCLKGFEGVESVETDCMTHRVVVKGQKAEPLKVLERLQRKSHRRVELISPIPQPPPPNPQPIDKPKPEDDDDNIKQRQMITVVLKVHMHCEACAQEIQRRIHRMKGVESVEPDLKSSQVRVKGAIDPAALVEYVHRRTGKHAAVVKQDPPENSEEAAKEADDQEKKGDAGEGEKKGDGDAQGEKKADEQESKIEEKSGGGDEEEAQQAADPAAEEAPKVVELEVKKNEYHHYPQRYIMEMYPYPPPMIGDVYLPPQMLVESYPPPMIGYAHPPQMFSDENPNSCSLM